MIGLHGSTELLCCELSVASAWCATDTCLVRSQPCPCAPAATYDEELKTGLLQLACCLIRTAAPLLQEHRKELLSFGWNHLKRDGSSCKYHAFLAVARFLVAFHAPEKITLQARVAKLKDWAAALPQHQNSKLRATWKSTVCRTCEVLKSAAAAANGHGLHPLRHKAVSTQTHCLSKCCWL